MAQGSPQRNASPQAASKAPAWAHLVAGAGGFATAVITSPLDVLRTRLQSDFYSLPSSSQPSTSTGASSKLRPPTPANTRRFLSTSLHHGLSPFRSLSSILQNEGWRGFYRGLGPSLAGVVPGSSIKFHVYGNSKIFWAWALGRNNAHERDSTIVHALSAMTAGITTATCTNPIWVVKTRLQLDSGTANAAARRYKNSFDCVRQILRQEGFRGLYRGLSASYLGSIETVLHLALYEQLKPVLRRFLGDVNANSDSRWDTLKLWMSTTGAAGSAKLTASLITYPHEVVRTRLRQAPSVNGVPKYTGLVQCFKSIWKAERFAGLYGGLTPHMARSVPSAMITLGVYEFVLSRLG
ncbi:mitochondrial carrier protein RIM2 [Coprinopsis cinerea okayama7|uniref:Mitochondrial carrier protein RIM2 n=1 Tax=Coprinopsis cinerea (strain Okayama-7 / 130 / ATCC MYA-4618 / FGSC 9003) TaxID=240176 RepID=A8NZG8_COPC7|nr:mitochondrial carrier protein RIM2 [Coprinopsis cinerea okayama7\|eukprot:XP_001837676.2 mitochondrial carrier protein RIM2 [Coprinopsis cinerea okayama7\